MIRRPPRSTRKESSAASDVYKRQAISFIILILKNYIGPFGFFKLICFVILYALFYLLFAYYIDKYLNCGVLKLLKDNIA
jgi:hypothetical protein